MESTKKMLFWRGTRAAYNALPEWNPWTYYTVKEVDGHWNTFYGVQKISSLAGQLEPVKTVVENLTDVSSFKQGDRFLVGSDAKGYFIVEIGPSNSSTGSFASEIRPIGNYSVRVLDRGGKEYQYVNQGTEEKPVMRLITYNDVDCGEYQG